MADDNTTEPDNNKSNPKTMKGILISVISILAVGLATAFVAAISPDFKLAITNYWERTFPKKATFTIILENDKTQPIPGVTIIIDKLDTEKTNSDGEVIITNLLLGIHNYSVRYKDSLFSYAISLKSDSTVTKPLIEPGATKHKSLIKQGSKPPVIAKIDIPIKQPNTAAPAGPDPTVTVPAQNSQPSPIVTANTMMDEVTLKVSVGVPAKRGAQYPYRYYLDAKPEILDDILEVSYQRNDESFYERKHNIFQTSDERDKNFEYIGLQWGEINTTYVKIRTAKHGTSDLTLKRIKYDNHAPE